MASKKFTNFEWKVPSVIATLPEGKDAKKLYNAIKANEASFDGISKLGFLDYNLKQIRGSNSFRAGQMNKLLKNSGVRVAVPGDDFNGDIYNLIKDKYYTDFNAFAVHKEKPNYEKNNGLWTRVSELIEEVNGSVPAHSMIQGFYALPNKTEKNYGIKIVSASNFELIEDDRLSERYNGWKFDKVDEKGLPLSLDKSKGNRTFYTRNDGLSRVFLNNNGDLNAWGDDLAGSNYSGRVVLVSDAEGVVPRNFEVESEINKKISKLEKLKNKYLTELKKI